MRRMSDAANATEDKPDPLSRWTFSDAEVSAGTYRVKGVRADGRSLMALGATPELALKACQKVAASEAFGPNMRTKKTPAAQT